MFTAFVFSMFGVGLDLQRSSWIRLGERGHVLQRVRPCLPMASSFHWRIHALPLLGCHVSVG